MWRETEREREREGKCGNFAITRHAGQASLGLGKIYWGPPNTNLRRTAPPSRASTPSHPVGGDGLTARTGSGRSPPRHLQGVFYFYCCPTSERWRNATEKHFISAFLRVRSSARVSVTRFFAWSPSLATIIHGVLWCTSFLLRTLRKIGSAK